MYLFNIHNIKTFVIVKDIAWDHSQYNRLLLYTRRYVYTRNLLGFAIFVNIVVHVQIVSPNIISKITKVV